MTERREKQITAELARLHRTERHFVHLDMLRGLAALGVLIGHTRGFIVSDYSATGLSLAELISVQIFYLITSLGHQCVIAFFALSGFLVGGPAFRNISERHWSWASYMLRRLTRLWMVLIPALFLTLGIDTAGQIIAGRTGYEGSFYHLIHSGPSPGSPVDLSAATLVANVLFLQTIMAPTFGSDGPLWSLANEFWYYITFPLLFLGLTGRQWGFGRVLAGVLGIALAILLPTEMMLLGLIWVAGAAAHYALGVLSRAVTANLRMVYLLLSLVAVAASIIVDKMWSGVRSDLILGAAFACMLPAVTLLPSFGVVYDGVAGFLAKISYTLYATHFPIVAFVWFVMLAPHKWPIGSTTTALMGSLILTALFTATGMWWLFERNTHRVRKVLERWLLVGVAT